MRDVINWWQVPYIVNGHILRFREWGSECMVCSKTWKSLSDSNWMSTPCLDRHDRVKEVIYYMLEPRYHIEKERTVTLNVSGKRRLAFQ